jgi:capsular exopolysaccharide synthesis family protein
MSGSSRTVSKDELIRQSKANLTVRAARETRVLEILFESPNPKLAADFANTLVSEFIEHSQTLRLKAFQRTAERLTDHLSQMKAKLEQAEAQLQDYVRAAGLTFTSEKDNVSDVRLVELQGELSRAQADRIAKQARFEQAKNAAPDALPEVLDDATLREYRLRLTELQRQLVELTATLTPAHYKVQRVQAQIDELQSAVQNQRALTLSRIGAEWSAAIRREGFLAKAYAEQQKIVTDQSGKGIRYRTLQGEVDSTRQLYEAMLERVKQAELAMTMRASNVLVIDAAKLPTEPYSPKLPVNAAIGLFSGVFLGLGFVFFRERVDRRIRAPGEARAYLQVSELGVTTATEPTSFPQIAAGRPANACLALPIADAADRPALTTSNYEASGAADCYRSIATSILFNEDNPRVVVVTSPCQGDGKTTVVSNLGLSMVEIGRRVLLIDADLRRPRLHAQFGLSNSDGLSNIVRADRPTDQGISIKQLLCETQIAGLYVLPAGGSSASSASVLHSRRMAALLECLRGAFDMVIVDAPPVLPVPDARVIGRLADGIVLVIRAGQTTIEDALIAKRRFVEDGTRVLGTILNGWNPKSGRGYGYGSYYGSYGAAG